MHLQSRPFSAGQVFQPPVEFNFFILSINTRPSMSIIEYLSSYYSEHPISLDLQRRSPDPNLLLVHCHADQVLSVRVMLIAQSRTRASYPPNSPDLVLSLGLVPLPGRC
jgi:hypothetical protein